MKWTLDWLQDYLKTNASAQDIADTLTRTGLEVEDLIIPTAPVAAKIIKCDAMPDSDHLHILQVDDGTSAPRQVVCGAPNARVGLISALARPGCVIQGHEIKAGKLRGVMSNGMMCSGAELGINDDNSGIMELPADTVIGAPVMDMPTVFDAGITPNRPDYLAVRGVARDLAAAGIGEYIAPHDELLEPKKTSRNVIIKTDKCPVYQFCEISNITVRPSNQKIAARLAAIGINPKNAPIDATNYICYDMAQPMHCFDADTVHGDIVVRMAKDGEKFTDLFDREHELTENDMVITDNDGILALAGVIGGARGATTDATKNVILESAYFNPVSVRKSAKRIGTSTDASYRYERGIDPTITGVALARAARIIMGACGGEITGVGIAGKIPDCVHEIKYSPDLFLAKTGIDMPAETQRAIFEQLGFKVSVSGNTWKITPRAARVDITIPENLVAELLRIYGYDKLAAASTHTPTATAPHNDFYLNTKSELAARGLYEAKSFGFGNSRVEKLLSDKPSVTVANPIIADMDTVRNSLLGNLLQFIANNEKRGYADLAMFELGTVFDGDTPNAQHTQVCIVRAGANAPRHWSGRNRAYDIYDVKADLIALMHGQRFTVLTENAPQWAHPFRYGAIYQGKKKIAEFGELSPMVARALKIKTNVMVAIVDDVANLPAPRKQREVQLSDFQPISRDFAFIVDGNMPAEKLVSAARGADKRITDAVVFDAFNMPDGNKSIAIAITIVPTDNMSDTDLISLQNAVIKNVETACNARIRDK